MAQGLAAWTQDHSLKEFFELMKEAKTCMHCDFGDEPVRMRRRWIHHDKTTGHITVCTKRGFAA